jgi:GT2 family glycosyltransferase
MSGKSGALVSIVLLNYNGGGFLVKCLDSILAQDYPAVEVIIVDNASTDGSLEILKTPAYVSFRLIANPKNEGFSRGMNIGMAAASGDFIMPLNFDIILEPDFISRMVETAESSDNIGSVTGKLLRLNDTGKTNIIDSTGHLIFTNRYLINRGEDQEDTGQFDRPDLVFGTCGAVPLYKRTMLDDIAYEGQYYDEAFFIMLEDVDIDWRAQLRGWDCAYTPAAVGYHYRGATASGKSRLIQRHYYKNRYLLMWQNDDIRNFIRSYPAIWLMDLYLFIDIIFTSPPALFLAWSDLIRLTPQALRKRRFVMSRRKAAPADIRKWFHKYRWMNDVKRKLGISAK